MELERRERYHIENNNCVNKCKPAQTHEEKLEQKKAYYRDNRETRLEQMKEYREANRDAILDSQKAHYEVNREKILDRQKDYRAANKEKIRNINKQRVHCPHCQKEMNSNSLSRHIKTQH
jgi:hypothetical protein